MGLTWPSSSAAKILPYCRRRASFCVGLLMVARSACTSGQSIGQWPTGAGRLGGVRCARCSGVLKHCWHAVCAQSLEAAQVALQMSRIVEHISLILVPLYCVTVFAVR